MSLAVTLLIAAAFCDGLLEGARWTDTEDAWQRWPDGTGRHDLYHPARAVVRFGAWLVAGLGIPFGWTWLGAGLLAFVASEVAQDAYTGIHKGRGLALVLRWRKPSLMGIPRYPAVERVVAVLVGGWLVGL